ncbi:DUF2059 domain-containing protein [Pseudooctadecabacter jejudonensis]|uniref:DUF2059 domain-containing protein n=1 Tax=Pseudooctadecabacter jejudonensis TaxID=1391910 RepID=A0A1Y5RDQ6_9RHOB|nr:DUF2059 domain-containing protein [Pseudooctadecabacter jejudonensis]SLN15033.1 hypothetical protein PSJ8397_00318 [Pseudooctadecabacter jejudonensis]
MFRTTLTAAAMGAVLAIGTPVLAQDAEIDALFEDLMLEDILSIMREEGLSYGATIGQDLFAGQPSAEWTATVERIYDYDVMVGMVREDFGAALEDVDLAPIIAFFGSDQGQTIVSLEVGARRAFLDEAVEAASEEAAAAAMASEDPRMGLVEDFVTINNLIETNVAASLNSNLAFYGGLVDGGAFGGSLTEEQILIDVWGQEAEIRANTTQWIHSFLFLAYAPLDEADLLAYIAFSETDAGEEINRAMFVSFERLFNGISRSLGRAAANEMTSQDL